MKRHVLLSIVILGFTVLVNGQWQSISTPAFIDPGGICNCNKFGEIASNSNFFWVHNIGCGNVSGFYSYYHIYKTTDGGSNWAIWTSGNYFTALLIEMEFISQDTGYIVKNEYMMKLVDRTSSGMNSFQNCYYQEQPFFNDFKMINFNDMWAVNFYHLYHLENDTFNIIYNFPSTLFLEKSRIEISQNYNIYIVCKSFSGEPYTNNLIMKSIDLGLSWDTLFLSATAFIDEMKFISNNIGFAYGKEGKILKTSDAGQNWAFKPSNTNEDIKSIDFLDELTGMAIGSNNLILLTIDGGETWNTINAPTTYQLEKVKFPENNGIVFIWTNNKIWKANIYDLITSINSNPDLQNLIDIYPNPAKNQFTIEIKSPKLINAQAEYYNLLGDKVFSHVIDQEKEVIDCSTFPKGIYLLKIENQGESSIQKLVIQ